MNKADLRRKDFEVWRAGHSTEVFNNQDEELLEKSLFRIGIGIPSIYNVDESLSIRLYASELLLKRRQCGILDLNLYSKMIQRLVSYAEYLDEYKSKSMDTSVSRHLYENNSEAGVQIIERISPDNDNTKSQNQSVETVKRQRSGKTKELIADSRKSVKSGNDRITDDALILAYFLSRMDSKGIQELGYKNFATAFKELGKLLERKPATIKNMRDEFDPYFDNPRAGWYQRPLRKSRQIVFDTFADITDEELILHIKHIISEHKRKTTGSDNNNDLICGAEMNAEKPHKTIIITNPAMKEIKQRKR